MLNMSSFKYVTRNTVNTALKINENIELEEHVVQDQTYFKIKNIFVDPEAAIEYLQNWPVLAPPDYTYTPGGRQNFTPIDVAPLVKAYAKIADAINSVEEPHSPTSFITASNVVSPNTKCWDGSWHPHADHDMVFNLWLCNWTEGTGLYTYKGVYDSRYIKADQKTNRNKIVNWQNFWSGDDYEHYHTLECEYNSLYVYNGKLFHGTIMGEGEGLRYSLISFYRPKESF